MLVCHCHRVTDQAIRRTVRDGATSLGAVGKKCGAGTCCGGCRPLVQEILRSETTQPASSSAPMSVGRSSSGPLYR